MANRDDPVGQLKKVVSKMKELDIELGAIDENASYIIYKAMYDALYGIRHVHSAGDMIMAMIAILNTVACAMRYDFEKDPVTRDAINNDASGYREMVQNWSIASSIAIKIGMGVKDDA